MALLKRRISKESFAAAVVTFPLTLLIWSYGDASGSVNVNCLRDCLAHNVFIALYNLTCGEGSFVCYDGLLTR